MRLLRQAGLLKAEAEPDWESTEFFSPSELRRGDGSSASNEAADRPIGVWQPERTGDKVQFRRSQESVYWCRGTPDVLVPKADDDTYRVCVIGESVANGMFYTPHYSPPFHIGVRRQNDLGHVVSTYAVE